MLRYISIISSLSILNISRRGELTALSTLPDNILETPYFRPYLAVSRLEYEISQIIAEVYHFSTFRQ